MNLYTQDIVEQLLARRGKDLPSHAAAARIVRTVFDLLTEHLVAGDTVNISRFGTFHAVHSQAHPGRNPLTGAPIQIPAKRRARFRAGQSLRQYLGDNSPESPGDENAGGEDQEEDDAA
ncbi:HU family DNA-binding protein [Acidithiobacillus montserratensis]|uniref:HU family DNA-binding protein n=1 Tax=Acidithiobacillus montserratensis TaxID=2729135 RepID=A0ACD5HIP3_9PROT|nr:HU family DNA-binding protein [Acidithiobacillus montserratensis]MBU2749206.1 HU family DNA-binding protein [Acidithiobacillus montserratensis]